VSFTMRLIVVSDWRRSYLKDVVKVNSIIDYIKVGFLFLLDLIYEALGFEELVR